MSYCMCATKKKYNFILIYFKICGKKGDQILRLKGGFIAEKKP